MKNKTNQIILIYLVISLFLAILCHKLLLYTFNDNQYHYYSFVKDLFFIISIAFFFKYILAKNEERNQDNFDELKKINEEINESNEKYDIVSKATSDTIWDWKIQENCISWNQGIENIFGYRPGEAGTTSEWWFNNIHPEDSIKMSVKLYSFLEQKTEKWQDQYRFKCADGTYKYVLDRGFLLTDTGGKAARMIGAIQDISKQKEEEQRLRLLETVITESRDSVIITRASSEDHAFPVIVYANPAFTMMSGYTSEDLIGKSPIIFKGPKSDISELKKLVNAIKNKEESFIETISYKKNREEYWVRLSMIPIYNSENVLSHWVSIQRDITEEKKSGKEKEHLIRELTQNNKDLKQFSYITSHNLRAPLSNLTGLLRLIDDIKIQDEELEELLNGFNKSTQLLNETINDLVKVIVIKDNPSIQKERLVLSEVFEKVFSQLNFQIESNNPILKLKFDPEFTLHTNKAYLESILLNLLLNAIKYKEHSRKLKITITAEFSEGRTKLTFKDNGIGIDLERNKDKVFGLYQRFHNYPDSKGLGLYLVKSQVDTMGGTISIKSEVNKGTEFTILF